MNNLRLIIDNSMVAHVVKAACCHSKNYSLRFANSPIGFAFRLFH